MAHYLGQMLIVYQKGTYYSLGCLLKRIFFEICLGDDTLMRAVFQVCRDIEDGVEKVLKPPYVSKIILK